MPRCCMRVSRWLISTKRICIATCACWPLRRSARINAGWAERPQWAKMQLLSCTGGRLMKSGKTHRNRSACAQVSAAPPITGGLVATCLRQGATAIIAPETLQSKVPAAPPITGGLVATCLRQGATAINAPEPPHSGGSSSIALGTEGPAPAINRIVRRRHADCKYCVWASFVGTGWFCALPKCIWK